MARADFVAAMATLRASIVSSSWSQASNDLLVARSWLAEEIDSGTAEGVSFHEAAEKQLDAIHKEVEGHLGEQGKDRRFIMTRTDYATR